MGIEETNGAIEPGDFNEEVEEKVETPESEIEKPEAEAAPAEEVPAAEAEPVVEAAAEEVAVEYQPDYSYKYNKEPKEVDEFFRPLMKDDTSSAQVKDMMTKVAGFDEYKQRVEDSAPDLQELNYCRDLYEKGDYEKLLEVIGLKDEHLFNVARKKLEREAFSPEQKQQYEENKALALEKERLERDNKDYQDRHASEITSRLESELESGLGRPEYQGLISQYEAHNGKGSFRNYVIERGNFMSQSQNRTVYPDDVLKDISKQFGFVQNNSLQQQTETPAAVKPKVIPNVGSSGAAVKAPTYRNLDELRKFANERLSAE